MSNRAMSDVTTGSIGEILTHDAKMDAIHIAVAPITANTRIFPGQHVGVNGEPVEPVGIVDPYLTRPVERGERCWLFLYPGTITSLRHEWTHPAFKAQPNGVNGDAWLRGFADEVRMSPQAVIDAATLALDEGEDHCLSFDTPERCWADMPIFWQHYEALTGRVVKNHNLTFFRCAC